MSHIELIAEALETVDRRLVNIERDAADSSAFAEETAKSLVRLQELYVSIDRRLEEMHSMMSNYIEATKDLRLTTRTLHSEVREKLKALGG